MAAPALVANRFEITRRVGAGGAGIVYEAQDRVSGRRVALKVLSGSDELEPVRFEREARVLATFDHPAIVRYVAHGIHDGEAFLAMEWLEGETLAQRLKRAPLSLAESLRIAIRIAEALDALHAREVVHRDVKPANIMLVDGRIERAKLLDFGLARAVRSTQAITRTGAMLGTPSYMAPEQARSSSSIDARADLFSLGAVLYSAIAGRPPFAGSDAVAIVLKLLLEEPAPLAEVVPGLPDGVHSLVMRLLAKAPENRPPSARATIQELSELVDNVGDGEPPSRLSIADDALTTTERRLMCLVLLRLVAFGDADVTRSDAVLAAHAKIIHAVLEPFRVRIELVGDDLGIVVVLGKPEARDLARVAARSALALEGALPESHIVVVSGGEVVSSALTTGNLVERGVRLLMDAERTAPAGIWIDEATAGLVGAELDVRERGPMRQLVGERDLRSGARTLLGKAVPCFGRERELTTMLAFFEECEGERTARGVLVTAPAGYGKSRVRYELLRLLEARERPPEVWIARSEPISQGYAFGLLGQLLRRTAGIHDGEPAERQRDLVRARVARHVPAQEAERVTEFLGEIARVPRDAPAGSALNTARRNAELMHDQMRRAWLDFLRAESEHTTLLIVVEDLQWGDLPTLNFLSAALETLSDHPLMLLVLARPEVHEAFPLLASGWLHEVRLARLTRRASERLARAALGESASVQMIDLVVERAQGNAFYLEELVRAVAERGAAELPETVLAMVQARLDALEPQVRQMLRAASVFGQTFWEAGVSTLLGREYDAADLTEWFDVLEQRELVTRRAESRFPAQVELVFRHALLREGAYATLTERDRQVGHRLAGRWLEEAGETASGILAEHHERGGDPARACVHYERAAVQALAGNDLEAALAHADRGLACDDGSEHAHRGALLSIKASAHQYRGENAEAERAGIEALSCFDLGGVPWCRAVQDVVTAVGRLGRYERLSELCERLLAIRPAPGAGRAFAFACTQAAVQAQNGGMLETARQLMARFPDPSLVEREDPVLAAAIDRVYATDANRRGDLSACLGRTTAAVARLDAAGDVRSATLQRVNLGYAEHLLGRYDAAEEHLLQALGTAERLALRNAAAMAKNNLGWALARGGKLEEGLQVEREAVDDFVAYGDRRMEGGSRAYLAVLLLQAADAGRAEYEARRAAELVIDLPQMRAFALGALAEALAAQGRAAEAVTQAELAMELLGTHGVEEGEIVIRNAEVAALDAAAFPDRANDAARTAAARVLELAAKISDNALRRSFLESVPENARAIARATACPVAEP